MNLIIYSFVHLIIINFLTRIVVDVDELGEWGRYGAIAAG